MTDIFGAFNEAFGFDLTQRDQSEGEPMEDSADYGDVSFGPLFTDPMTNFNPYEW